MYKLTESLNISEYLNSFPGPSLYPRDSEGKVCALFKGIIYVFIKNQVGNFNETFYGIFLRNSSGEAIEHFRKIMAEFNEIMEGGHFIGNKLLGKNEITFADVMLYPFVYRLDVYKNALPEVVRNVDLSNIWAWLEKINAQPWASSVDTTPARLQKLAQMAKTNGYEGLKLPLTIYDE